MTKKMTSSTLLVFLMTIAAMLAVPAAVAAQSGVHVVTTTTTETETETEEDLVLFRRDSFSSPSSSVSALILLVNNEEEKERVSFTMLRGGVGGGGASASVSNSNSDDNDMVKFPPIPPIHPHHTGSVHYSSVMNADGTTTYRRDITAPCDYGMLLFNVGPALDNLPYQYDLYGDVYLWSDNGGLCLFYPTYTGYQTSTAGPFWKLGYDPTTVNFADLTSGFRHMHRISSRIDAPGGGTAHKNSKAIDKQRAGDYIIMAHHNFYSIEYYKQLKHFVNSWVTDTTTNTKTTIANTTTTTAAVTAARTTTATATELS